MTSTYLQFQTSCKKDEAIALLIGLGDLRETPLEYIPGVPEEYHGVDNSFCLLQYLDEKYGSLKRKHLEAKQDKQPKEVIAEKLEQVTKFKEKISKAKEYLRYFDDEVAKGESSAIRAVHNSDNLLYKYYTFVSIHEWAVREFNNSLIGDEIGLGNIKKQVRKSKMLEQEEVILGEFKKLRIDPEKIPKNSGKAGVKAQIKEILKDHRLFKNFTTVFDSAWDRLRQYKKIREID